LASCTQPSPAGASSVLSCPSASARPDECHTRLKQSRATMTRPGPKHPPQIFLPEASHRKRRKRRKRLKANTDRVAQHKARIRELVDQHRQRCQVCESAGNVELHHVDPSKKLFTLAQAASLCKTTRAVLEELAKCVALCRVCHEAVHSCRLTVQPPPDPQLSMFD
jgi:hypothetical protein